MTASLYTTEEKALFDTLEEQIENGTYTPISGNELNKKKEVLKQIAKNTITQRTKKKTVNIRIAEYDLARIKAISLEQGVPYQTLIGQAVRNLASRELVK